MALSLQEFLDFTPTKPTYALFGHPIAHSLSPELHSALFDATATEADYVAIDVPPEQLPQAFALAKQKLQGINLTIPHKKAIMALVDTIDPAAVALDAVNTVRFTREGNAVSTCGFNTDVDGFAASLAYDNIALQGSHVLLLGYGGAAGVMGYHCVRAGAKLTISGRDAVRGKQLRDRLLRDFPQAQVRFAQSYQLPRDIQIVLNGTPLGMHPHEGTPAMRSLPKSTKYVFDAIYNPPITATMQLARGKQVRTQDGMRMLVMQAAVAQTIWYGADFSQKALDKIMRNMYGKLADKRLREVHGKQNLVLCGFMGVGKTTAGKLLAKTMHMTFIDADRYLEERTGRTIPQIFATDGEPYFRALESECLRELSQLEGYVIALGGGAVMRAENVESMKKRGLLVLLDPPWSQIVHNLSNSANRPLFDKNSLAKSRMLYDKRRPIYQRVADVQVRNKRLGLTVQQILTSI